MLTSISPKRVALKCPYLLLRRPIVTVRRPVGSLRKSQTFMMIESIVYAIAGEKLQTEKLKKTKKKQNQRICVFRKNSCIISLDIL